jgi:hypothetical protein
MPSERTFYKTVIQFEVLSEEPLGTVDLETIDYETTVGCWSGRFLDNAEKKLNGKQMAKALKVQGSDPEFFRLSEDGEDLEE